MLSLVSLAACDSATDLEPGGGDDPGGGTGTLVVNGTVSAEPSVRNSSDPANFTTELTVRITRGTDEVVTGTVEVESVGGVVGLLYDTSSNRWRGAQAGYFEVYRLDIASGDDSVDHVRVDGPDIHTVSAPAPGATVDSRMPLAVAWTRDEAAEAATVETRELSSISIDDTGTYSLTPGSLKSKSDQVEDEEIQIRRSQVITPAGAAAGSSFRVTVRNSIQLLVQPTQ